MERSYDNWIGIQVRTQYERSVKSHLQARVLQFNNEKIIDIFVPEVTEVKKLKTGKTKKSTKRLIPGYVMVQVIPTDNKVGDDEMYIIRGTPNVISFLGNDKKKNSPYIPVDEVRHIFEQCYNQHRTTEIKTIFKHDDKVKVISGPFEGFSGYVLNSTTSSTKVVLKVFNKDTIVTLNSKQLQLV